MKHVALKPIDKPSLRGSSILRAKVPAQRVVKKELGGVVLQEWSSHGIKSSCWLPFCKKPPGLSLGSVSLGFGLPLRAMTSESLGALSRRNSHPKHVVVQDAYPVSVLSEWEIAFRRKFHQPLLSWFSMDKRHGHVARKELAGYTT